MVRSSSACSKGCILLQDGNPLTIAPSGTAISFVRASSLRADKLRACCSLPLIFLLPCRRLAFLMADLMWLSAEGTWGMRWKTPAKFSTSAWAMKDSPRLADLCYNPSLFWLVADFHHASKRAYSWEGQTTQKMQACQKHMQRVLKSRSDSLLWSCMTGRWTFYRFYVDWDDTELWNGNCIYDWQFFF